MIPGIRHSALEVYYYYYYYYYSSFISLKDIGRRIYFLLFQQNNLKAFTKVKYQSFLKLIVNVLLNGTGRSGHLGRPFNYTKKTNKMINETFKS